MYIHIYIYICIRRAIGPRACWALSSILFVTPLYPPSGPWAHATEKPGVGRGSPASWFLHTARAKISIFNLGQIVKIHVFHCLL